MSTLMNFIPFSGVWDYLTHLGVEGAQTNRASKTTVATNVIVLVALLVTSPYPFMYLLLNIELPFWLVCFFIVVVLAYPMILYLNAKKKHLLAKNTLMFFGGLHLYLVTRLLPYESGLHFFLLGVVFIPFFIYTWHERKYIVFSESVLVILIFYVHYSVSDFEAWLSFDESSLKAFYFINLGLAVFMIAMLGYQFFKIIRRVEFSLEVEKQKSESLLLNILPAQIAHELKTTGSSEPRYHESVTVLFTDFVGFTTTAEKMHPHELVHELDIFFKKFDSISEKHGLEKLKTIGDSYMCVGGLPLPHKEHALHACLAALEIQKFMNSEAIRRSESKKPFWQARIGIHTGPVVSGVIGNKKFAYDIWGDTVNLASRLESAGAPGRVNISKSTCDHVKDQLRCEARGHLPVKSKGNIEMFFVASLP